MDKEKLSELGKFLMSREIKFVMDTIARTGKNPDTATFVRFLNENHPPYEHIKMSTYVRWVTDPDAKADAKNTQLLLMRWDKFEYDPGLFPAIGLKLPPKFKRWLELFQEAPDHVQDNVLRALGEQVEDPEDGMTPFGELARATVEAR